VVEQALTERAVRCATGGGAAGAARRVRALALVTVVALVSLLPWVHFSVGGAEAHACCLDAAAREACGADAAAGAQPAARVAAAGRPSGDACWICHMLASLLQDHARLVVASAVAAPVQRWVWLSRPPVQAPAHLHVFPACRAQAPPAAA